MLIEVNKSAKRGIKWVIIEKVWSGDGNESREYTYFCVYLYYTANMAHLTVVLALSGTCIWRKFICSFVGDKGDEECGIFW